LNAIPESQHQTPIPLRLGLRENWRQFALLALINAFVGALVGMERSILPILAQEEFGLASKAVTLSFLISFGLVKAFSNLLAGRLSERLGRKRVLVAGWLAGLAVPLLLILAPGWEWIIIANVLLGINQGLCWSTTVIMKIDLVGPRRRGLAMGLNEAAGYLAVSFSALLSGYLSAAHGVGPASFLPGLGFAGLGLLLSATLTQETLPYAHLEAAVPGSGVGSLSQTFPNPPFRRVFFWTSWQNRTLFSLSQAGLVNNLNDGVVWGLLPLYLVYQGLPLPQIAVITALYPAVWGVGQLAAGILSDHLSRKGMIAAGMMIQAVGIGLLALGGDYTDWVLAAILLGVGTALVYPTLLAAVSDAAHPAWRATALGVYRLWRDSGYAIGGLLAGLLADAFGIPITLTVVSLMTLLSGVVVMSVRQRFQDRFQ